MRAKVQCVYEEGSVPIRRQCCGRQTDQEDTINITICGNRSMPVSVNQSIEDSKPRNLSVASGVLWAVVNGKRRM